MFTQCNDTWIHYSIWRHKVNHLWQQFQPMLCLLKVCNFMWVSQLLSIFSLKKNQISSTQALNFKNKRRKFPHAKTCTVQMSCAVVSLLIRRRTTVVTCWLPCCRDVVYIFYLSLSAAGSCSAICDVTQLHGPTLQLLHGLICKEPNKQSALFGEAHVWDDDEYLRINTNTGKQNERASVGMLRSDAPRVLLAPVYFVISVLWLWFQAAGPQLWCRRPSVSPDRSVLP